jgi:hypothetical protein
MPPAASASASHCTRRSRLARHQQRQPDGEKHLHLDHQRGQPGEMWPFIATNSRPNWPDTNQ